jgi:hypothetical protein
MIQHVYFDTKEEKSELVDFVKTLSHKVKDEQKLRLIDKLMMAVIGTQVENEDDGILLIN